MLRTVFLSIIRSLRLCIQHHKQAATESVWHVPDAVCTILDSWWWTEGPSETCRVLFQYKTNLRYCTFGWFYYRNILRCTVQQRSKVCCMNPRSVKVLMPENTTRRHTLRLLLVNLNTRNHLCLRIFKVLTDNFLYWPKFWKSAGYLLLWIFLPNSLMNQNSLPSNLPKAKGMLLTENVLHNFISPWELELTV